MLVQEQGLCICHTVMSALLRLEIVALQQRALHTLHKPRWFELRSRFEWVELLRWKRRNQRMLHKKKRMKHHS